MGLPVATFVAVGILLTVGFEFCDTNISLRWTYADLMPLVPPFGIGLSPLLQWLIIPPLVIWLTRRHLLGARVIREAGAWPSGRSPPLSHRAPSACAWLGSRARAGARWSG